ncbi:hypothetical protein KC845_02910 [Candidatus Kaiserbacteria bacterium]|nr:hypothetical protein [Candidatus Kaiserbacteria bacterium]
MNKEIPEINIGGQNPIMTKKEIAATVEEQEMVRYADELLEDPYKKFREIKEAAEEKTDSAYEIDYKLLVAYIEVLNFLQENRHLCVNLPPEFQEILNAEDRDSDKTNEITVQIFKKIGVTKAGLRKWLINNFNLYKEDGDTRQRVSLTYDQQNQLAIIEKVYGED